MAGRSSQLRSTEIDGIKTFFVETGQTYRATLSFRAGAADETLATRGLTHLAEHVVMHGLQDPRWQSNAGVDAFFTAFTVAGEPSEVVEFIARLCEWLREPPCEHLAHERKILLAESASRGPTEFGNHISYRFGARGFGLGAYDELGLHQATEQQLRALVARSFVRGNAVLSLNGPPPAGLRLDLPEGPPVPMPVTAHLAPTPPYHVQAWTASAASSGLCHDVLGATVGMELLRDRVTAKLRTERAQSYATTGVVERVGADTIMVLLESDVTDEGAPDVVDVVHHEYSQLGTSGPTDDELDLIRRRRLRAMADDLTGEWQTITSARNHLRNEPPVRSEDLRTFLEHVTPEALAPTLADLARSLVVSSPAGIQSSTDLPFETGFPALPAPVDGRSFKSALAPLDPAVLVVSDSILEIATTGGVRRTDLRDCVALQKYADGGRGSGRATATPFASSRRTGARGCVPCRRSTGRSMPAFT